MACKKFVFVVFYLGFYSVSCTSPPVVRPKPPNGPECEFKYTDKCYQGLPAPDKDKCLKQAEEYKLCMHDLLDTRDICGCSVSDVEDRIMTANMISHLDCGGDVCYREDIQQCRRKFSDVIKGDRDVSHVEAAECLEALTPDEAFCVISPGVPMSKTDMAETRDLRARQIRLSAKGCPVFRFLRMCSNHEERDMCKVLESVDIFINCVVTMATNEGSTCDGIEAILQDGRLGEMEYLNTMCQQQRTIEQKLSACDKSSHKYSARRLQRSSLFL